MTTQHASHEGNGLSALLFIQYTTSIHTIEHFKLLTLRPELCMKTSDELRRQLSEADVQLLMSPLCAEERLYPPSPH